MTYIVDHIPRSTPFLRRTGIPMTPTTITIHNTGNPTSSARNERNWLTNPSNKRRASFHIGVDENGAIECIPINEVALHAGTAAGNRTSIGIELCESGDYDKTLDNAVELVATMLKYRGWGVDRLRRHFDWSKKICPHLMYDGGKWTGWTVFKARVSAKLEEPKMSKSDALAVIVSLQKLWSLAATKEEKAEIHRQANAVRKSVGIPPQ